MSSDGVRGDDDARGVIAPNKMIREVQLLQRRHWSTWVTLWPFALLYAVAITLYVYPELVWDRVTYLVHQTYIDFFHAICIPVILFAHAFLALFTTWSVRFRALLLFHRVPLSRLADATHVLVCTHVHKGDSAIVPLLQQQHRTHGDDDDHHAGDGSSRSRHYRQHVQSTSTTTTAASARNHTSYDNDDDDDDHPPCFVFQQRKWKLDEARGVFVKPRFPTHESFAHYVHWGGLSTPADTARQRDAYGDNRMEVAIPDFQDLFVDHALAPFFVFQMFCVLLWCLDEYWYYSLFMGVMMVVMECVNVWQRLRNMRTLRSMAEIPVRRVTVLRRSSSGSGSEATPVSVLTTELLPMDLLVVPNNVPCPVDAVLVRGTAVVNESTLTGESTPQLKEALDDVDIALSAKKHARHLIFSGTHILLSSGPQHPVEHNSNNDSNNNNNNIATTTASRAATPGCALAVVLKTGFETKQGKLLRTILHSQGRVSENSGEAFGFIGVLLVFALAASGYLLRRGLADPTRSRWKLFLSCVQILTAVVPPELPMELTLAVNNSLMELTKLQVFCTEPFRIPFAGKVDTCCFDKTGTLTTDEMLFGGVDMVDGKGLLNTLKAIPARTEMVLATCHSLVYLDAHTIAGDEMEKAATSALGYCMRDNDTVIYNPTAAATAAPATGTSTAVATTTNNSNSNSNNSNNDTTTGADAGRCYTIVQRYPFLAALRRMSCVVRNRATGKHYLVTKGSPEAVAALCTSLPRDYATVAERTASQGYRVIALAYRELSAQEAAAATSTLRRDDAERQLQFAGLAIYVSPLKKDARATIMNLEGGSHRCVIITGDSVQTAISVGREVGLLSCKRQLCARTHGGSAAHDRDGCADDADAIAWHDAMTGERVHSGSGSSSSSSRDVIADVFVRTRRHATPRATEYDLCVDAEHLSAHALETIIAQYSEHVRVWARCAPTQKEAIVTDLKRKGHVVLMAGDGTNDVGALKQAHAGIAVLNSAAVNNASTTAAASGGSGEGSDAAQLRGPQPHNEPDVPAELKVPPGFKFTVVPPQPPVGSPFRVMLNWKMAETRRKQEIAQIKKWNAQLAAAAKTRADAAAAMAAIPAPKGSSSSSSSTSTTTADVFANSDFLMESLFNADDDGMMPGGAPMIKLGDASIAAPFTCRSKALTSVCDIVRLGRSTLVTTHMMYKILALNCLTSAYSMSVLHSDGVKLGEKQMILAGVILSVCFMCMSRSKPLTHLCPQRPVTRVFHPYMICSVFGQFALHLYSMITTAAMVREVDQATVLEMRKSVEDEKFKPTLLNSTMFLMTTLMSGVTFAVNYRGEPFMQSIRKNRPMFIALIILAITIVSFAGEGDPEVNALFEIVAFPSPEFRARFLRLLALDSFGCFAIEAVCLRLFTDM